MYSSSRRKLIEKGIFIPYKGVHDIYDPDIQISTYNWIKEQVREAISEKHVDSINSKFLHSVRRELTGSMDNLDEIIQLQDFHLYTQQESPDKRIIANLVTYYDLVTNYDYDDPMHIVGQIILNEVLASLYGRDILNITHAIANNINEYKEHMNEASTNSSLIRIENFVNFMLTILTEQIEHAESLLECKNLYNGIPRVIKHYNEHLDAKIPEYAIHLLKGLLLVDELPRGKEVQELIGKEARMASKLIKTLLDLQLILPKSEKGKIRLNTQPFFRFLLTEPS